MRNSSRFALPLAVALFSISSMASAVVVPGVYSTGLGVGGSELGAGDGQVDANYTITATTDPSATVGANALTYYNPAYFQDGPLSRVVNATGDANGTTGAVTTFTTTFSLANFETLGATLTGQVLADDMVSIFFNGASLGTFGGFNSLTPFSASSGFLAGLNTLSFAVTNGSGPTAFQVAGLTVTAAPGIGVGGVPEPASWAMLIAGFGLTGAAMRRRAAALKSVAA